VNAVGSPEGRAPKPAVRPRGSRRADLESVLAGAGAARRREPCTVSPAAGSAHDALGTEHYLALTSGRGWVRGPAFAGRLRGEPVVAAFDERLGGTGVGEIDPGVERAHGERPSRNPTPPGPRPRRPARRHRRAGASIGRGDQVGEQTLALVRADLGALVVQRDGPRATTNSQLGTASESWPLLTIVSSTWPCSPSGHQSCHGWNTASVPPAESTAVRDD
jgi:hypothetical protein